MMATYAMILTLVKPRLQPQNSAAQRTGKKHPSHQQERSRARSEHRQKARPISGGNTGS